MAARTSGGFVLANLLEMALEGARGLGGFVLLLLHCDGADGTGWHLMAPGGALRRASDPALASPAAREPCSETGVWLDRKTLVIPSLPARCAEMMKSAQRPAFSVRKCVKKFIVPGFRAARISSRARSALYAGCLEVLWFGVRASLTLRESWSRSTGLTRCRSKPAAKARSRSSGWP